MIVAIGNYGFGSFPIQIRVFFEVVLAGGVEVDLLDGCGVELELRTDVLEGAVCQTIDFVDLIDGVKTA